MTHLLLCILVQSLLRAGPDVAERQQARGITVEDLFRLQALGPVRSSPDGKWLAVVITRPWSTVEFARDFPSREDRADVWLLNREGGEPRNLTNGVNNGSGYWNPVWSPDGKRLAMLSNDHRGRVRPYVWDISSRSLRPVTERTADVAATGPEGWPVYGMVWSDSTTLLCPVLPEGSDVSTSGLSAYSPSRIGSYQQAMAFWADAERGVEPTASVLESGREIPASERPAGALLAIDVVNLRSHVAAQGNVRQLIVSPTRRHLAVIAETGRRPPAMMRELPWGTELRALWRTRLGVLSLSRGATVAWLPEGYDPKIDLSAWQTYQDPVPHSWSPDGTKFAFIGKTAPGEPVASTAFILSVAQSSIERVTNRMLFASKTAWSESDALMVLAGERTETAAHQRPERLDWWAVSMRKHGPSRKLTADLASVPSELVRSSFNHRVVGISGGDLWSIDGKTGQVANLTSRFQPDIRGFAWPTKADRPSGVSGALILEVAGGELYQLNAGESTPRLTLVPRPANAGVLVDLSAVRNSAVYVASQRNGTFVWVEDSLSRGFTLRLRLNPQLDEIADPKCVVINYRGVEGDTLRGLILLPIGYQPGVRYPLITYVFAGLVVNDTIGLTFLDKSIAHSLNLNLLSAQGYAVLLPSVPLTPNGVPGDPMLDLPKGVLPAVDKAIDVGVADPHRLGVMGQSYGGYSVYALITHTNRFKVAIAMAGPANLVSLYGSFFTPIRYNQNAHEELFEPALAESGQVRMGRPPWADLWRYLRNSPIHFVERVQTPIMIIQGDIDYIPIQQGEEFFTALYRQGKKARFVRYWGEGHIITSPANVRHMWHEIFGWLKKGLDLRVESNRCYAC